MDLKRLDFSLKTVFCLLAVFAVNTFGQTLCTVPLSASIKENNVIGETVSTLTLGDGVSAVIIENPEDAFGIDGNLLVAVKVLDFEALADGTLRVGLTCIKDGESPETHHLFVTVENVNDNSPVFDQSHYDLAIAELSAINTNVGKIEATDADKDTLYYRLEAPMGEFGLLSSLNPQIQVLKILDYDTTPEVDLMLFAQDTPLSSTTIPSHTASASIKVNITDINNRPPWFEPCDETAFGTTKICLGSGYEGKVNLNEQAAGALTLQPGPVHAIDGDKGRNDEIGYRLIGHQPEAENGEKIFIIDQNTGSITMQHPVSVAGTIVLTVMAYEVLTPDQLATTTVTIHVVINSIHPPEFVKSSYEGFISEDADVGSLVLERRTSNKPLQVQATDADFSDGVNPDITFEVEPSNNFRITPEGFILMTSAVPQGTFSLNIRALDTTNGEFGTASLSVEVTPGVPTTTMEMPTTTDPATTLTTDMTTSPAITTDMTTSPAITTDMTTSLAITTDLVTQLTESTSSPDTITSFPSTTLSSQTDGLLGPAGDYKAEEMAALGASLAVVLLICLVVIGLLVYRIKRQDADWKKLSEASIFRSTLTGGTSGPKDGVQYTNEGFQNEEDADSVSSKQAAELPLPLGPALSRSVPQQQEKQSSAPTLQSRSSDDSGAPLADSSSLSTLDNTDSEKEVKPILTKERRVEDGYKAVWFKQDIDPNVKEEVVIISDSGERDASHDDDDEEEEEEDRNMTTGRMGSDSDDDDPLTSDL